MSRKPSSASRMLIPSVSRGQPDNMDMSMNGGGNRGCIVIERDADTKSVVSIKRFYDDQDIQVHNWKRN
jgi:hypothetical protein